jgi:SAM-dependent methyltransferase
VTAETKAGRMRRFWDRRAREDAFYFVDNRLDYGRPELERFWNQGELDLEALLSRLDVAIRSSDRVVEIGCGVGRLTRPLSARASHVLALDVSAEMLTRARRHNPQLTNVTWIHGDGISLAGIDDSSVDACVSHVVFQHIPDPEIVLGYVREMGRVLRGGGWAAFQVSNDPNIHLPTTYGSRPGRVRGFLRGRLGRGPKGQDDPAWLGSAVDLDELTAAAEGTGMAIERVEGAGTQFCLIRARRLLASHR